MAAGSYEKTNLGWRIQQSLQQFSEWLELTFFKPQPSRPVAETSTPAWLEILGEWLLKGIAWILAVVLLVLFVQWAYQQIQLYLKGQAVDQRVANRRVTQPKINDLSVAGWLQRSQEWQRQGNYREACRALYMAMLQRLHDAKLVPHELSRTDGEYRQVVQTLPQAQLYETLIAAHEQLCFGDAAISLETFNQCQRAYREIESS